MSVKNQKRNVRAFVASLAALGAILTATSVSAQSLTAPETSLCTTKVTLPPPAPPAQRGGAGGGRGQRQSQPTPTEHPQLSKLKDNVYIIRNVNNDMNDLVAFGGNLTFYITDDGIILFDSKNDAVHDEVMQKIRSVTDKPIKYLILTHNHLDHAGGSAKMQQEGATVIMSREDRENMTRLTKNGLAQVTYSGQGRVDLGGKTVVFREFCAHTDGDTVAFIPEARVLIAGDIAVTAETIPQIVNYGDGGTWTDLVRVLDELAKVDFDILVGGHGPPLTKAEFLKHRDKMKAIRTRFQGLVKEGKKAEEIVPIMVKEFKWGDGPSANQIAPLMIELK